MPGSVRIPPSVVWGPLRLMCRVAGRPARRMRRPPPPPMPQELRRVLIQAPNWLGDCVMALPLIAHVRTVCPSASISIASRPAFAALWELLPQIETVLPFDRFAADCSLADLVRFVRRMRDGRYDASIILAGGFEFALLHAGARIRVRIGYDSDNRGLLLTHPLRVPADPRARHMTESYLDLGRVLGPAPAAIRPRLRNPERRQQGALLHIVVHPWATYGPAKRWPAERFAELGNRLVERYGAEIVLVGTDDARAIVADINRRMANRALDLTGRTSLRELCAVMQSAALVISCDSGPAHLADALEVPLVVLFGSSSPTWTAPRGPHSQVIYRQLACSPCFERTCRFGTYACFEDISADEVLARIERVLGPPRIHDAGAFRAVVP